MKTIFEIPDSLFVSSTIIDGMGQTDGLVKFTGRAVANDDIDVSEWHGHELGFVISDVKDLDQFDRMLELARIVRMGRKDSSKEFFFYIGESGCLIIYYRIKSPPFG